MNNSEIFKYVHAICKRKNVAYFGGYQKCFGHFLKQVYADGGLVNGFTIQEPRRLWA